MNYISLSKFIKMTPPPAANTDAPYMFECLLCSFSLSLSQPFRAQ